ncbi:CLUMA_CG009877, isoform A [Clunio marinus]|uniref:CLUMA_CG009877, isoform A n=1 Tax=Clunio marinus TaxID=568069 RepID=A0A1J1I846_9DIPT|nr:CLUMA_CG009877, isoform A [Clunio marinus]
MNTNNSPKFLCRKNEDTLQPINTQFSGIFNKALFTQENLNILNSNKNNTHKILSSPQLSESSNSTVETIDYEFLTPKTKAVRQIPSSPNKELNLTEYFGKFMEKPKFLNLDSRNMEILKKVSNNVPADGNLTFKTNASNDLTNVIYFNIPQSKLINHNIMSPASLGLKKRLPATSTSQPVQTKPAITAPAKRKVGRPRNESKKSVEKEVDPFEEDELISHRTKSGRIVKFNPDVAKIFQLDSDAEPVMDAPTPKVTASTPVPELIPQQQQSRQQPELLSGLVEPAKKPRKISSEFRCTTCKKIYLGKNKMNHHFKLFPDHRPKKSDDESILFTHLMSMVRQKKKNKDMADVFFKELSNFVQVCEKLTPKLITNKDNHPNTHHHVIDKNAASLLRINPGNYRLNMNVFDKTFKLDNPIEPIDNEEQENEAVNNSSETNEDHHELEPEVVGHEVIKALDDVPSLDGNEVNLLIRQTNELTNLTNISDIVGETEKIEQHINMDGDNALLGFLT